MNSNPFLIDLFAGCGGLGHGLEEAGFQPIFVNELNDHARQTYLINRVDRYPWLAEAGYSCADVKELVKKSFLDQLKARILRDFGIHSGEVDLIVGGPPCQGFSGIGHRRSYSVDKEELPSNHLYVDMAAIIRSLQPKAFLFENVRGLLNARWTPDGVRGEIWQDVVKTFKRIPGYSVSYQLVFAKDYGVPQNRPRVLLVGLREDMLGNTREGEIDAAVARGYLPQPVGGAPDLQDLLGDLVDPNYVNGGSTVVYPDSATTDIQKRLRTPRRGGAPLRKGAALTEHDYSKHSDHVRNKFKSMQRTGKVPEALKTRKFSQRVLPPVWGKDGPSITATSLCDDYVHFEQPRVLTVREWARLQTFPDWYQFAGKRTTGGIRRAGNPREGIFEREVPKYTQIGNAVPVALAEAVGRNLRSLISRP